MDAPLHYGNFCENKPSKSIEDIPLEWCFGEGYLIDVSSNSNSNENVSLKEVKQYIKDNKKEEIKPNMIILIYTGACHLWGKKEYFTEFRGVDVEVIEWLTEKGVKIIGVDTFGFDPPFNVMLEKYQETKEKEYLWPAHMYGREREYCQIERLTNLEKLKEIKEFKIACFPIKISSAGAGWTRVVAIY